MIGKDVEFKKPKEKKVVEAVSTSPSPTTPAAVVSVEPDLAIVDKVVTEAATLKSVAVEPTSPPKPPLDPNPVLPPVVPVNKPALYNPAPRAPVAPPVLACKTIENTVLLHSSHQEEPPALHRYWLESTGLHRVQLSLDFSSSENFILVDNNTLRPLTTTGASNSSGNSQVDPTGLCVVLVAEPFAKSVEVAVMQDDEYEEAALGLSMSWCLKDASKEVKERFLAEYEDEISNTMVIGDTLFPVDIITPPRAIITTSSSLSANARQKRTRSQRYLSEGAQCGTDGVESSSSLSVQQIEAICANAETLFVDMAFPPTEESLMLTGRSQRNTFCRPSETAQSEVIVWRRPKDFIGLLSSADQSSDDYDQQQVSVQLFEGEIEPADIKQGKLGDCWLMCALACISEYPVLVQSLFLQSEASRWGVYQLRLCKHGHWAVVTLDDFFPCAPGGGAVITSTHFLLTHSLTHSLSH
jgi:hypothetical protein